jgi:sulfite exporter TauE/SafE
MEKTSGKISLNKSLLTCGILYSLLYISTDILAGLLYPGYSFVHQAISEESAIGAPTRYFVVPLLFIDTLILLAFGWGVWRSADRNRVLRFTGGLLILIGLVGLAWTPFPMHLGEPASSFANIIHSVFAGVQVLLVLLAIGSGGVAYRNWFRFYSIGTILALFTAGVVSFWLAASSNSPLAPPWFGVIERINVYGFLLWIVVLAIVLLRTDSTVSST